jgi:hypothetical protein
MTDDDRLYHQIISIPGRDSDESVEEFKERARYWWRMILDFIAFRETELVQLGYLKPNPWLPWPEFRARMNAAFEAQLDDLANGKPLSIDPKDI